jgi:hypothetical protein
MTQLTNDQYEFLIRGIDAENRVSTKQNQSHVEAWDVRRHLIRAFGFGGFDIETIRCELIREIQVKLDKQGKPVPEHTPRWTVVYRADVRLTIKAVDGSPLARYEDGATGDAINMPSIGDAHDFAMKTALSQALKRCAVNLGDQFGLALYNGGKPAAVVLGSLVRPSATAADKPAPALPADDAPVQPEPTPAQAVTEEAAPERAATPPAPAAEQTAPVPAAEPRPAPTATGIRDWVLKSSRTASEIQTARAKLLNQHPAVAAQNVKNEHDDVEASTATPDPQHPHSAQVVERRRKRLFALYVDLGYGGDPQRNARRTIASKVLGREVSSMTEVTALADIEAIITALEARQRQAVPAA